MRKKRNPAAVKIANDIIAAYKPESVEEMQEAIKDVFGPMFEAILNGVYGFKLSAEQISKITDFVLEKQRTWQNRPLKPFYPFIF